MKILITGANGQLGKCIRDISNHYPEYNFIFLGRKELDIVNKEAIRVLFDKEEFDYCVNTAAYTNVEKAESEKEKAFLINEDGVKNLAKQCKKNNTTLIQISTDYVFDGKKKLYKERDIKNPLNFYGMTKSLAEDYIIKNLKNYSIIRSSWIYSNQKNSFIKKILNKIKKKKQIYGVIDTYSGPTSTKNLSKAIDFIIKNNIQKKILHYCDGNRISPYDFILKIINISNIKKYKLKKVKHRNLTLLATRPKDSYLGISKELKNVKSLSFDEQIKSYVR